MTGLITLTPPASQTTVDITAEGRKQRDALILEAKGIAAITTPGEVLLARQTFNSIAAFLKDAKAFIKAVKDGPLAICRRIDTLGNELTEALDAEKRRLATAIGHFEETERLKAEQARRAAEAEQRRIREEAERVEREAREKAQREAAELAAKANAAKSAEEEDRLAQEALARMKRDAEERKAREAAHKLAMADAEARAHIPAPRVNGASRQEIVIESVDVHALYAHNRLLVTLTPALADIKRVLAGLKDGETLPGVVWRRETKAVARAGA